MRVKLLTSLAGRNFSYRAGQEVDLDDADAERLIEKRQAEAVGKKRGRPPKPKTPDPPAEPDPDPEPDADE